MTKDEIKFFMSGVKLEMTRQGLSQKRLAVLAGTTNVTISRYINGKGVPSQEWIDNICLGLRKTENELVAGGKPKEVVIPPEESRRDLTPLELQRGFVTLIEKYQERSDRMRLWLSVFEELPLAALLIRDGVVLYQNSAAKQLGIVSGESICDNCESIQNCFKEECAINMALATGIAQESYNYMGDRYFHVRATPFRQVDDLYFICTADEIPECGEAKESLAKIWQERTFLAQCKLETPEYYADANRLVRYCNQAFLDIFNIKREDITTTDQFISLLNAKLFSPKKITTLAEKARLEGISSNSLAKLSNNETMWFNFIPNVVDGKVEGVMVICLDMEMYEFRKNRGEI